MLIHEQMNLKICEVVVKVSKWPASVGANEILNVAWVNVKNIPTDKRNERNVAYVGSVVGFTLEINMSTLSVMH